MKVMAFDPGTTTGVAWADLEPGRDPVESIREEWRRREAKGWTQAVTEVPCGIDERGAVVKMVDMLYRFGAEVGIIEDFILLPPEVHGGWSSDRKGLSPVRIAARMDQEIANHVWPAGVPPEIVMQMPGERTIITPERLKRWGLWVTKSKGGGKDAMAALQHLIVYGRKLNNAE